MKGGCSVGHCRKKMISFFVTTDCNLACDYCYVNVEQCDANNSIIKKNETIDIDFALEGLDFFLEQGIPPHLRFFGPGEPTMRIDIIKKIVEHAREKVGDLCSFEIQTNGAFPPLIAKYLAENIDIIWVSSDGLPQHHDAHRKNKAGVGSSSTIEKNIRFLVEHGKGMTGIRATITQDNVNLQSETLQYFASLGVRYVWTDPIFPPLGETADDINGVDPLVFAQGMLSAQKVASKYGMVCGSLLTANFDEEVDINCRACLPMPHLTTDGFVSACDLALFGNLKENDRMYPFIYGRWNKENHKIEFDYDKIKLLQSRKVENMPACQGCIAQKHCAGWCLGEILNETGTLFGQKPGLCEGIRYLYENRNELNLNYTYLHP